MSDHGGSFMHRVLGAFGIGTVSTAAVDTGNVQTVQVVLSPSETIDAVPVLHHYGFTSSPFTVANALVAFVTGDRSKGVVIATGDQRYRLKGLTTGEVAIYTDQGAKVHLTRTGIVIDGAGLPMTIQNVPQTTMSGTLTVTGDVIAGGAGGISLQKHVHGGVETGNGDTGVPVVS